MSKRNKSERQLVKALEERDHWKDIVRGRKPAAAIVTRPGQSYTADQVNELIASVRIQEALDFQAYLRDCVAPYSMAAGDLLCIMAALDELIASAWKPSDLAQRLSETETWKGAGKSLTEGLTGVIYAHKKMYPGLKGQPEGLREFARRVGSYADLIGEFLAAPNKKALDKLQAYVLSNHGGTWSHSLYNFTQSIIPRRSMSAWKHDANRRIGEHYKRHPGASEGNIYKAVVEEYNTEEKEGRLSDIGRKARDHMQRWEEYRITNKIRTAIREYTGSYP